MKCPHCYCNYDDSERECPMCGKRAGVVSAGAGSRPAQTARRAVSARAQARPASARTQARPAASGRPRSAGYNQNTHSTREAAEAQRKRRSRVIRTVVLVILLVQFLPGLIGLGFNWLASPDSPFAFSDNGMMFFDSPNGSGASRAPEPAAPASPADPEEIPAESPNFEGGLMDGPFGGVIEEGIYYNEWQGLTLTLDYSDESYCLFADDYDGDIIESGYFYAQYNEPDSGHYTEEFPIGEYYSFVMLFAPDEEWLSAQDDEYHVAVLYSDASLGNADFYLDNSLGDTWWLPLSEPVYFAQ